MVRARDLALAFVAPVKSQVQQVSAGANAASLTPTAINGSFIIARRSEWPPRELYFIFCTTRSRQSEPDLKIHWRIQAITITQTVT